MNSPTNSIPLVNKPLSPREKERKKKKKMVPKKRKGDEQEKEEKKKEFPSTLFPLLSM
jgi:hypothetical protein